MLVEQYSRYEQKLVKTAAILKLKIFSPPNLKKKNSIRVIVELGFHSLSVTNLQFQYSYGKKKTSWKLQYLKILSKSYTGNTNCIVVSLFVDSLIVFDRQYHSLCNWFQSVSVWPWQRPNTNKTLVQLLPFYLHPPPPLCLSFSKPYSDTHLSGNKALPAQWSTVGQSELHFG